MDKYYKVYAQRWRNNGKADGWSLHKDADQQIEYMLSMLPRTGAGSSSYPYRTPEWMWIETELFGPEQITALVLCGETLRIFENGPPWLVPWQEGYTNGSN